MGINSTESWGRHSLEDDPAHLPGVGKKPDPATLLEVRGNLDSQLDIAMMSYSAVVDVLNSGFHFGRRVNHAPEEKIRKEFQHWLSSDYKLGRMIAYANDHNEVRDRTKHTLNVAPNVRLGNNDFFRLVESFGKTQPCKASTVDKSFLSHFTPAQLFGTVPENGDTVLFSLIPEERSCSANSSGNSRQNLHWLHYLQQHDYPFLKIASPYEDVVHWFTQRDFNIGPGNSDFTHRYANLPPQRDTKDGRLYLPCSYIDNVFKEPVIKKVDATTDFHAFYAIS